jgi:hypothetical protein
LIRTSVASAPRPRSEIEDAAGVKPVALLEIGTEPPLETVIFWRSSAVLVRPDCSMTFWSMRTTGETPAEKAVSVVGMYEPVTTNFSSF